MMRFFLVSLLSLFFLSSCGGQKKVIGEWKYKGDPKVGFLFLKNGTGTFWNSSGQDSFEWKVEKKVIKISWHTGEQNIWKVEDDILVGITEDGKPCRFYERAK
ncbi:hypothetical protein N9961_00650 [bacterium]|nr:hypothetical protein [bacterium]